MGSRYLTDMANVLRGAGLNVKEEPGWTTRARGSGGYESGRPTHVMCHHTASGASSDGQSDVNYMCYGSGDAPIANLYLSRSGKIWVMAAGATNTNGKGGPLDNVPLDSMNTYAIGIEAANNGTGEQWPQVQQETYAKMVRALTAHYAITNGHIRDHAEWAPGRKCDITGPARWGTAGGGCSGAPKWNMSSFRADVAAGWPGGGPLPPPGGIAGAEEEQLYYFIKPDNEDATTSTIWVSDMKHKWAARSNAGLQNYQDQQLVRLTAAGMDVNTAAGFNKVFIVNHDAWIAYGISIDPNMPGRDAWGWNPNGKG